MTKFTYIDLFSGIGGFRIALDAVGGTSMGYSEIDKQAIKTYKDNFKDPDSHDLGDVTKITELEHVDIIVGGVPCQSWSVAGKKRGFDDPRGKLWYDAIRMVGLSRPKTFIFENVKGLGDPRNKANLDLIISSFEEIGYRVRYKMLNTYDFGVPQNRSRIFIVGFRNDLVESSKKFNYPKTKIPHKKIGSLLKGHKVRDTVKSKFDPVLIHGKNIPRSRNAFQKIDELNDFFIFCDTRNGHSTVHSWDIYNTTEREKIICNTILHNRRKKKYGEADGNPLSFNNLAELVPRLRENELNKLVVKRILRKIDNGKYAFVNSKNSSGIDGIYRVFLPNSHIFSTLTATGTRDFVATDYLNCDDPKLYKQYFIDNIFKKKKFRQVSAREAARIQGFPDSFKYHESEYSALKQFGNAVSPPVVKALAKEVINSGIFDTIQPNDARTKARNYVKGKRLDAYQFNIQSSQ